MKFPTQSKPDTKPAAAKGSAKGAPKSAAAPARPMKASTATPASTATKDTKGSKGSKAAKPGKASKPAADPNAFLKNPVRWLKRLFRRPVRLKRQGLDFKLVLDDPATRFGDTTMDGSKMTPSDTADVQAMRLELGAVLDRDPRSRSVLVHLNMLERALKTKGMKAFEDLPAELLRKAMAQLDTLVMDWSARGLTLLRARASGTLARTRISAGTRQADFGDTTHVQVREASVTTFMEVEREWEDMKR
ncbi:hypothetical protein [Rhizobacter sp. OV335]|uniref:hypothetical protein n=1 Tax=Rhizobacter sp. OV335 TaxID=1500264 RepID=UPI00091569AD|nr:hypothetical protein [Rhizobacter sp. OV335]SHM95954.1 hypothetical protein SAMN02787076_02700 [Rhizobacter sp. OV335]